MKTEPVRPARIVFDGTVPEAPDFGDIYHARAGAYEQARHVFLRGNGLPERWQRRGRFVIAETGFGLGHNFLATWAAWRDDPARCDRLWFVSVEKYPPTREDLARAHAASPLPALAAALVQAWPPLTPNLHTLAFDDGRVLLLLSLGDAAAWVPQWIVEADAFYLDGFAPARNPAMWDNRLLKALGTRAAPGATLATWCAARAVRDGLTTAGFVVESVPGLPPKREMTLARHAPAPTTRRPRAPLRHIEAGPQREAVIVGAGLAGAAAAWALAEEGWTCTVIDRHAAPARAASGNSGGLFHGIVHAHDGLHARAYRAAALEATRELAPLVRQRAVPGQAEGLLRLDTRGTSVAVMQAMLQQLGLPPDHAQALSAADAAALSGLPLADPAWWFPGGGWLDPGALVRHWLGTPGVVFRGEIDVGAVHRAGRRWQLIDTAGRVCADTGTLVLAGGASATQLAPSLGATYGPLEIRRGQVSVVAAGTPGLRAPRRPVAGRGYALTLANGDVLCGATSSVEGDAWSEHPLGSASTSAADHRHNLERLAVLTRQAIAADPASLAGRVGWRLGTADRLPLIGALPAAGADAEQVRTMPRQDGLFVCTALGSRGITWAVLAGRLVAHVVAGTPAPAEAQLVDALDPARFSIRDARRAPR